MSVLDSTPLATRAAAWRISPSVAAEPSRKVSTAVARKGRDANPVTPTRARLILLLALRGQAAACLLSCTSYRREGMRDLAFRPEKELERELVEGVSCKQMRAAKSGDWTFWAAAANFPPQDGEGKWRAATAVAQRQRHGGGLTDLAVNFIQAFSVE